LFLLERITCKSVFLFLRKKHYVKEKVLLVWSLKEKPPIRVLMPVLRPTVCPVPIQVEN